MAAFYTDINVVLIDPDSCAGAMSQASELYKVRPVVALRAYARHLSNMKISLSALADLNESRNTPSERFSTGYH